MKIADYGKAITSYIQAPTREQKELSKLRAEVDFSGMSAPALKLYYERETGLPPPEDPRELIIQLKRLIKGFDEEGVATFSKGGRVHLADGTPPPRKPKELKDLFKKIDTAVLAVRSNTVPPEFIVPNLEKLTQEYISDGLISGEDARKFAIERKDYYDNFISKNVGETVPAFDFDNEGKAIELSEEQIIERINEADGGRIGFQFGGGKDAQMAGTEASRIYFRERKVDKPTPTYTGGTGNAKLTGVKFANPAQEKEYIKLLTERYKYPKGSKEGLKLFTNAQLAEKFGMTVNNVEKVNNVLKKQLDLKYPAQTYEGYEKIARERDVKRKGYIRTTSDPAKEQKIKRAIKTVDKTALANDVDIAHRASLKANTNIGGKYLVSSLGIDPKVVNQSIIIPIEQKLGTLYENQKNLIKNLKPGKVPKDIQKQLEKINIKISELVDRTDGVLQGVLVDEKNLKPRIYGIDYSKVLGFGLIDDKPIKDLTQEDIDLIKLNVGEQIKTAKKPKFKEKLLKTIGTGAKAVGKVFKPLGYAIGTGAAISAKSQADELGIELSPLDYLAAIEMGDPDMAIKTYKMRTDPEFAKQEEAKTLAIPLDEGTYDVMNNQSTFGKYNDQIKNIKLP